MGEQGLGVAQRAAWCWSHGGMSVVGWGILVTHLQREGAARRGLEGGTWVLVPVLVAESVVMGQRGGAARHWSPRVGCQWWDGCVVAPRDVWVYSATRHGVEVAQVPVRAVGSWGAWGQGAQGWGRTGLICK